MIGESFRFDWVRFLGSGPRAFYSIPAKSTEVGGGGLEFTNTFTITIVNEVESWGGVYALAEVTAGQTAAASLQSLPGDLQQGSWL